MYVTLFSISRLAPRYRHLGPRDTEEELAQLSKQLSRQFKELAQLFKKHARCFFASPGRISRAAHRLHHIINIVKSHRSASHFAAARPLIKVYVRKKSFNNLANT